jgi:hypothetical protein
MTEADANVSNLVSWWKFNEGSGVTAYDSAGTNDGTIYGAAWTTDYTGIALDFDGDDYVGISDNPSLRFNLFSRFSLCSWAKPVGGYIVGKMRNSAQYGYFGYNIGYTSGNKYYFTADLSSGNSISIYTKEIPQGDWSHVTAVYDNRNMKIYLDGELEGTGRYFYDVDRGPPDKDLTIGARSAGSSIDNYFIGIIDDVRIYNKALSVEEVRQVYEYVCPNCPPLMWISPKEFIFLAVKGGLNPESQVLRIRRKVAGTLNWEIRTDCNWVSAEPNSGKCTTEVDDVNIVVDISGLGVGLHECELSVSDPNAVNSPQTATVTLHVLDDYELHVPSVFETIQEAIDLAFNGASIIVAPGTYTGPGNRDIDFKGLEITVRSTKPNDPNVVATTVIDCQGSESEPHRGFYFHSGEDGNSVLDGFTIRNGYVESRNDGGGGICCIGSSPIISNCIITNNKTGLYRDYYPEYAGHGGGVFLEDSKATIVSCIISNNRTDDGAFSMPGTDGGYGGGIYCEDSSPRIINCLISNNVTGHGGDGDCVCELYGCICSDGGDGGHGGGIYLTGSAGYNTVIAHCTITGNTTGLGGWVFSGDSTPGEQGQGGGIYVSGHQPDIIDSIFWGNNLSQIHGVSSVSYCDVQGGYTGIFNISDDPRFVSGPFGDYYLSQTAAGQVIDSLCVGRGSNTAINLGMDIFTTRADEFLDKGIADMGYHYAIGPGSADIDENLHVDCFDYSILAADWRNCNNINYLPGDITRDTCVNGKDLKVLVECWLDCYVTEATNPVPADEARGVDPNGTLSWVPGMGALYHDVYFGTDASTVANAWHWSPEFMGTVSEATFDPCGLDLGTIYYWRIDEVGLTCTTQGDVWSFTTAVQASNPSPVDTATNVSITTYLNWTADSDATSHDVYFGTNPTPGVGEFEGNQTSTTFDPGTLGYQTTYYWRVDEVRPANTTQGEVWSFTTLKYPEPNFPLVGYWKFDDGSGGTATDSAGTNNGTLNGNPTWTTGQFDGALSFDGAGDYVSVAPIVPLIGNTVTAQAWIRIDESAGPWNPLLMQNRYSDNLGFYFYISNDRPDVYVFGSSGYANANSSETLNADQWYHVAATNDGFYLKLYVDGQFKDSDSSTGLTGVNENAYIGYEPISSTYYMGLIDDVRIYDGTLTAGEIERLYEYMLLYGP